MWTERDRDDVCWAREWLPDDLGQAVRVFSVSYNAHVVFSPHDHVSEIADNLFLNFVDCRYKWEHPIILIGHSFGGLVLKSLVVKLERGSTIRSSSTPFSEAAAQRAKSFLKNLRGVAFYAFPHAGSTNFHTFVNKLSRCTNRHLLGIMGNIEPYRRDMNQLSVDFDDIVNGNKISIYAFSEGKPMDQEEGVLVEFSSAQQLARNNCYKVEDANHMEVCKPPSKGHPSYGLLLQFINACHEVSGEFEKALQEVQDLRLSMFVGLHKILSLLKSEDIDVRVHAVKVVANLAAEEANQEKIVEAGGLGSLLNLLQSSEDETIRRVAAGAVANLAMNETNQELIMAQGGIGLLARTADDAEDPQTLRMVAGAIANLCGNGYKTGRSLLIDDGALPWIVANANNDALPIRHHIELALCHLAQHEVNAKDLVAGGALWELVRMSRECSREDIRNLAQRTLNASGTLQSELRRLHLVY
ncbi:hypothetical protein BDL97_19G094100 [Sphagnum fallax]|nr:hypothetical protein BDL97_19G094100 [Sphagnum fallax]